MCTYVIGIYDSKQFQMRFAAIIFFDNVPMINTWIWISYLIQEIHGCKISWLWWQCVGMKINIPDPVIGLEIPFQLLLRSIFYPPLTKKNVGATYKSYSRFFYFLYGWFMFHPFLLFPMIVWKSGIWGLCNIEYSSETHLKLKNVQHRDWIRFLGGMFNEK